MGMAAALSPTRHVIEVVDALDREVDVIFGLDVGEIAPRIRDTRKLDDSATSVARLADSRPAREPRKAWAGSGLVSQHRYSSTGY